MATMKVYNALEYWNKLYENFEASILFHPLLA